MTNLRSTLLQREMFEHGFGTRRTAPDELPRELYVLRQIHGEKIVVLSGVPGPRLSRLSENLKISSRGLPARPYRFDDGDAMVGDLPGVSMGIRTADCLPILLADRVKGTAAAVHCGWRSLAAGLAGKAVSAMTGLMNARTDHLLAVLGPSLGPCCYEGGEEVREGFPAEQREEGLFEQRGKKLYLDLASGGKTQLVMEGISPENVEEIAGCTSCNPDLFWSHRARREEERMVSFITVREPYAL